MHACSLPLTKFQIRCSFHLVMTFYDTALQTEREILVMATFSKLFDREISLAVSEAAKALGYEL